MLTVFFLSASVVCLLADQESTVGLYLLFITPDGGKAASG